MTRLRAAIAAALLAGCAGTPDPSALPAAGDADFPPEAKRTASMAGMTLPAWPVDEDLIPVDAGRAVALRYFVDGKSLAVTQRDVVRFTLVGRGAGGAENVTHEAFRCSTGERTVYAYGRADRTWREVADPQWEPIRRADEVRRVLMAYHLCPGRRAVKDAAEGVNALKYGHPEATSAGPSGGLRPDRGF